MTTSDQARGGRVSSDVMNARDWSHDGRLVWAHRARASSSFGGAWTPDAVVGPPRVFPNHGDLSGAWAPKTHGAAPDAAQWLEADFPKRARACEVWIFETNLPGAVVEVIDQSDPENPISLWSGERTELSSAHVLTIPITPPRKIRTLRLRIDASTETGWPEIDAIAIVRDMPHANRRAVSWLEQREQSSKKRKIRTTRRSHGLTTGAKIRLGVVFAAATAMAWSCVAPRGLVVSEITPARVESAPTWTQLASSSDVRWMTGCESPVRSGSVTNLSGPPDGYVWWMDGTNDRLAFATVSRGEEVETKSIVLVETRPFAVVRIDDVSSPTWPVTIWRGATTNPRRMSDGAIRIDLSKPRTISRLRLVVDREIARGSVDAIGLVTP